MSLDLFYHYSGVLGMEYWNIGRMGSRKTQNPKLKIKIMPTEV